MKKVIDEIEERTDQLPLRKVKDFLMDEISLILKKAPFYSATSIELRADDEEEDVEVRALQQEISTKDMVETPKETFDNSEYKNRIKALKTE